MKTHKRMKRHMLARHRHMPACRQPQAASGAAALATPLGCTAPGGAPPQRLSWRIFFAQSFLAWGPKAGKHEHELKLSQQACQPINRSSQQRKQIAKTGASEIEEKIIAAIRCGGDEMPNAPGP